MKSFRIVITAAAKRHLREALEWMAVNFASGRDVFQGELEAALHRLAVLPFSGSPFPAVEVPGIRRVLLRRSQYHVYYEVDETQVPRIPTEWEAEALVSENSSSSRGGSAGLSVASKIRLKGGIGPLARPVAATKLVCPSRRSCRCWQSNRKSAALAGGCRKFFAARDETRM